MEFSFQRVKTTIKDAVAQKIGFPKSLTTFLKKGTAKQVIFRIYAGMSDTELVTTRPQR